MNEERLLLGLLGLIRPHTHSTLVGICILSFETVKFFRLTAIPVPPPRLFLRGLLMYFMPFSSRSSSIFLRCFLFSFCSHISVTKHISVSLSSMSVASEAIFGNRDRALYTVRFRRESLLFNRLRKGNGT